MKQIHSNLAATARALAKKHKTKLSELKDEHRHLERPDFLWHYLLQSFATMGRAAGWKGLIGTKANYDKLRFHVLSKLSPNQREKQIDATCRAAKIRMPSVKAGYILRCFEQVRDLGGPEAAKQNLLAMNGRQEKITFLKSFRGIGDKYARNIMMDVYHPDFRDSIAIDARIKSLSTALGLRFTSYVEHEQFYLSVADRAGLNGWELDRLIFNFQSEFLASAHGAAN